MIRRITDPAELNYVVNLPDVLDTLAPGYLSFDLTDFVNDPDNVALQYGPAVAIFRRMWGGEFDGHYLFPATVRGKDAVISAKKIIAALFTSYGAGAIHGHIPRQNRAARVITRALGFKPAGAIPTITGPDQVHYVLERAVWVRFSE